jgi:hypothetical protein
MPTPPLVAKRFRTLNADPCARTSDAFGICPFSWIAEQRRRSSRRSGAWFESPLAVSADKNAWPASSRRVAVHAVVLRRVVDRARVAVTLRSARPGLLGTRAVRRVPTLVRPLHVKRGDDGGNPLIGLAKMIVKDVGGSFVVQQEGGRWGFVQLAANDYVLLPTVQGRDDHFPTQT